MAEDPRVKGRPAAGHTILRQTHGHHVDASDRDGYRNATPAGDSYADTDDRSDYDHND